MSAAAVPVRLAATVVLLRDGVDGLEAWLLTRVTQMVFAAGMTVFPGGRVDLADSSVPLDDASIFAQAFDCSDEVARSLVVAAVRETFEETGVLLTDPAATLTAEDRRGVESGELAFADLLAGAGLSVDASLLRPWARWITPEGEVRRYDTHFFVAALPPGSTAASVTSEASTAAWVPVASATDGTLAMLPPTLITLRSLAGFATVADVLAGAPTTVLAPVSPTLRLDLDVPSVELPDGTVVEIPRALLG